MTTLSEAHKSAALRHLNQICPDTFDEGEFGPWSFIDLERQGEKWTLSFKNGQTDSDDVTFAYAGDCLGPDGTVSQDWFERINEAILEWEQDAGDDF